jgi:hypothetical protein
MRILMISLLIVLMSLPLILAAQGADRIIGTWLNGEGAAASRSGRLQTAPIQARSSGCRLQITNKVNPKSITRTPIAP